jgi:DNA polymerase III epsilon subunit-like protein
MPHIFLDLETTGLEAGVDEITEAAWRLRDGTRRQFFVKHTRLPNQWVLENTDYLTRILPARKVPVSAVLDTLKMDCERTAPPPSAIHLVGACPSFDDRFIRAALGGAEPPYHYHVICVEVMTMGLMGWDEPRSLKDLRSALGIDGANLAPHTAEGDALEAENIFDAVLRARKYASKSHPPYVCKTHPLKPLDASPPNAWAEYEVALQRHRCVWTV